jgi:hypothetical protein
MTTNVSFYCILLLPPLLAGCVSPKLPGVGAAMQAAADALAPKAPAPAAP